MRQLSRNSMRLPPIGCNVLPHVVTRVLPHVVSVVLTLLFVSPVVAQPPKGRGKPADRVPRVQYQPSDGVKVVDDVVYARYGEREVQLDLYLPKQPPSEHVPCVVVIHGGGWRSGDKSRFAAIANYLAERGFAAACIGYRLLPEAKFPEPIQDCKAAVRWVRANAQQYGIDPDRIGAIGGSAGAHLAAMLATSHKVAELEGDGGSAGVSSRVQAVVAMATPADMTRFAQRAGRSEELAALISPITHVDGESAPILLMHSDADRTVPYEQSVALEKKYKEAGVAVELVKIADAPHAFWNLQRWFDEVMPRAVEFFRETLGKDRRQADRE